MKVLYIDDNRNNLSLMKSVVAAINEDVQFVATDSPDIFLKEAGESVDLYIIDFTLEGILGDVLYEKLLNIHNEASVIITSAGYIRDLQDIFLRFDKKPIAITDRFGAIDILREELS
jgi:response regulator RpfG family c-di-GMP phosphodiesterase